jgi:two-component system, chemotaxis family, chemotaxis protein CheY
MAGPVIRATVRRSDVSDGTRFAMSGAPGLEGKTVMIVDDDHTMRMLIRRMLARMKIANLLEAEGGEQALKQLEETHSACDLIISDWNMPGMSGIEFYDRIHAIKPDLPFLMLTGRSDAGSVIAAKKAGIPAYIVKPISPEELKTKISFLLTKSA